VSYNPPLPSVLRNDGFNFVRKRQELLSRVVRRREFVFGKDNLQGQWTVNGRTWANGGLEANPGLGDVEIWKLVNGGGGWHHPIHIHLVDLLILSRNKQRKVQPYEMGWKDVFYLDEGADIEVVAQFGPNKGKYMMHCHNLVHEDHDMMRAFEVGQGGPDPVTSAPARPYNSSVLPL
jgi:spore coat protein A, manganese oxidase